MIPAFGMVILPQNPSIENGKIPGCSCILSVDITFFSLRAVHPCTWSRPIYPTDLFGVTRPARGQRMRAIYSTSILMLNPENNLERECNVISGARSFSPTGPRKWHRRRLGRVAMALEYEQRHDIPCAGTLGRPMSCVPGYFEVINTHTVGFLTIPRASIKWV